MDFSEKNRFFKKNDIFYLWDIHFSRQVLQEFEKKIIFCKNLKNRISQLSYALLSVKKYIKLDFLS